MFRPLSKWMEEKNSRYYQSPDTSIHGDFLTYAQSPEGLLTRAHALDFHGWAAKNEKDGYSVLEVGVGTGAFAQGFLAQLKEQDEKCGADIFSRTHYTLADFSPAMLKKAQDSMAKAGFLKNSSLCEYDAGAPIPEPALSDQMFDLIRCNELFSDLPAEMGVRRNARTGLVYYDEKMAARVEMKAKERRPDSGLGEMEESLLSHMPANYFIPFNKTAARSILNLRERLARHGRMDIFDYGFYRREDFDLPPSIWNDTIVREYGGQWTVDLNFIYLACALAEKGARSAVEEQKEYAQRFAGGPLGLDESEKEGLGYVKAGGRGRKNAADKKADGGKSMEDAKTGSERYREDDFFYHMRIEA